ncbi:phage shock protein operon transcriptional activator [Marinomonas sp. 15G1-11]|uniref:Phage shock protein operon transcriptional activator n=1 Tax=Marinomonas phaeophyticola TaxID=3004091 RepID=A0ABT4JQU5_9GAMM|nr:phage shock protein operon transcriptional activator [Marinomonas sp. 15G1-11]MCZ2720615.1 phage shock protein operon transcriptional activator [Marinomonas sp. 15G1-11]
MNPHTQRIIGSSQTLSDTLDHASSLAKIDRPILIFGERGSGKEMIAQRLHYLSHRWDQPYITINCAAISENLMESELFGHETGAFTGASKSHKGHFERADKGTLFLDELGTMSLRLQEKLLRLIEYGEFEKLGSTKTQSVDVRVIAATNANLVNMSQEGEFRADLLDRLTFDVIQVPPLRERHEDVEELAHFFAIKLSTELMWDYFSGFTENALNILKSHSWPGNIRELKNVVERSVYRWGDQDLPVDKIIINPFENNYSFDPPNITPSHPQHTHSSQSFLLDSNLNLKEQTQQLHIHLVKEALKNNQHNQKNAASQLGLSYDQIRGLIRKYHLNL